MFDRRVILVLLGSGALGCPPEGAGGGSPGEPSNVIPPTPSVSSPIARELEPERDAPDGGQVGLEFDPASGRFIIPEAGPPPPKPLRADTRLTVDSIMREEQIGVVLEGRIKQRNVPAPPKSPEVNAAGIAAAAKLTTQDVTITLTALGRMGMVFESRALPLPFHSEIRARFDRTGHLVLWPGLTKHRVVPPGALRATLGERRVDVSPMVPGTKHRTGNGKYLEQSTRTVVLDAPIGRVRLDLANVVESGLGGPLACRFWVETVGIEPHHAECKPEEVPLSVSIDWTEGGGIDFDVTSLERRSDLPGNAVLVPPPNCAAQNEGLPDSSDGIFLTQDELAQFRTREVEIQVDPAAPLDGFIADNGRDRALVLYLDGVPVVAVPPLEKRFLVGAPRGHYVAQWRTFLGDYVDSATVVDLPGVLRSAPLPVDADAGAP